MDITQLLILSSLIVLGSCCSNPFEEVGSQCLYFGYTLPMDHQTSSDMCALIKGKLAKIDHPQQLTDIVQYIYNDQTLYSSYWIDGAETDGDWLYSDGQDIPRSTPYWATFINDNQEYDQQPVSMPGDNCLSLQKESSYFFSSNSCSENQSPLCEEITGTSSNTSVTSCGGDYTTFSGHIQTPNYPGAYPDVCDCTWTITRRVDSILEITIIDFDTVQNTDHNYLEIRDGPDAQSPLLGKYYGHAVPTPISLVTTGHQAWLRFWSNDNSPDYRGFDISWTTVSWIDCQVDFYSPFGDIQSPWYPEMYPSYLDCVWTITADVGSTIALTTVSFDTEKDIDVVQIRDGADNTAPLLTEMSDHVEPGYEVRSTSNQMFISFRSDEKNSAKGFAFKWAAKETCPLPYSVVGDMCLHFNFIELTYGQSAISCQELGGQLASITNSQDLRDLYMYLHNQDIGETSFWLGGSDSEQEGLWRWKDDSLVPRGTPFWGTTGHQSEIQEPFGGEHENCLLLEAEGFHYFRDSPCDTKASALCMYLI